MIDTLTNEIDEALKHDLYFSALTLALTLPDICGKAKYPNEKSSKKRYIDWYNEYVGRFEKYPVQQDEPNDVPPYLSGDVVYSLRCSMLHQGNPNIDNEKCGINHFSLVVEKDKPSHIYLGASGGITTTSSGERIKSYSVSVRRLCMILTSTACVYYEENTGEFDFFNYSIVDWDMYVANMKALGYGVSDEQYQSGE